MGRLDLQVQQEHKGCRDPLARSGQPGRRARLDRRGRQGLAGPAGPAGPQGEIGPQGLAGVAGPAGPAGPQGEIGPQGLAGAAGPAGLAGPQGEIGPQGLEGPQGPAGAIGPDGPQGPQGLQGPQGVAGPPVSFQGTWDNGTTYRTGDAVFFNGSSYISLVEANDGNQPDTSVAWALLAQQGLTGATGTQGLEGAQGPAGAIGPDGPQGPQGIQGPQGVAGPPVSFQGTWDNGTTYRTGDAVFFNGSSYISLVEANDGNQPDTSVAWALLAQQGLTGATGTQGLEGAQGPAGAIGPDGPQGPQGIQGPQGVAGPPVSFQGTWDNGTTYRTGDAVFFNGSSYISLVEANDGNQPDTSVAWALLAQQGL